ncbi:Uncharacterised protein [Klebsiella pneumoniae]|nr:Uncharacterised protein [Klebsiella pneumoniae]
MSLDKNLRCKIHKYCLCDNYLLDTVYILQIDVTRKIGRMFLYGHA